MSYTTLTITRENGLAIVTLGRGAARNALNVELISDLRRSALELREDRNISAVILTGDDKSFSAGADRKDARIFSPTDRTLLDHWKDTEAGSEAAKAWESISGITIAAIEGFAIGGGFTMAMACDFRVMAESAFIQIPEVPLGFNYGWNSIPRMVNLIGPARTKRVVVMGEKISAPTALDWGLADYIAEDGNALLRAREIAQRCLALPQMPVQFTKRSINALANQSLDATSHADMAQILLCLQSAKASS